MIKRPVLRYHGGKWRLAKWIISHFPDHIIYVEPFGGAASVLLQKPRSNAEVYNDLDDNIVNVFRVLRDPEKAERLLQMLYLTPFARAEFHDAYKDTHCEVEHARRTIVRSFMGYSSDSATRSDKTGFRSTNFASGRYSAMDWASYPDPLRLSIQRLRGVTIENRSAIEIIQKYDSAETLFYIDPPYVHSTRHKGCLSRSYQFEMSDDDHAELADVLLQVAGKVVISGYESSLYNTLYRNFEKRKKETFGQAGKGKGSKQQTEILWISEKAQQQLRLFDFDKFNSKNATHARE